MVDMMEEAAEGRVAEEGLPEKEPETIGEALKKYYEEQLSHAGANVITGRLVVLNNILAQHYASFN